MPDEIIHANYAYNAVGFQIILSTARYSRKMMCQGIQGENKVPGKKSKVTGVIYFGLLIPPCSSNIRCDFSTMDDDI